MGKLWSRPKEEQLNSFIEYVRDAEKDSSDYQVILDACKASGLSFHNFARLYYHEEAFRQRVDKAKDDNARYIFPDIERLLEGL